MKNYRKNKSSLSAQWDLVVSAMGAITPLGANVEETWNNYLAGASGIVSITDEWAKDLPVRIAGKVANTGLIGLNALETRRLDRCSQLALVAAREAWKNAQPYVQGVDSCRIAVVVGSGIGGLTSMEKEYGVLSSHGLSRVSPLKVPMLIANASAGQVAIDLGVHGGAHTPVSACASGAEALLIAKWLLEDDRADVVIAGGSEAPVNRLGIAGFAAMRALSTKGSHPSEASRPYAKDREGFVLAEGAGMLILQRSSDISKENSQHMSVLRAIGSSNDGVHMVTPEPEGRYAAEAIRDAFERADVNPDKISFIQGHATGTRLGDLAEANALRKAFGELIYSIPVTAPKGQLGHMLGASGSVETILAIKSLEQQVIPASINSDPYDDDVGLNIARTTEKNLSKQNNRGMRFALKNSFGFGGHNICLLIEG